MLSLLQRKSLTLFHPLLRRLVKFYLRKPRTYRFESIKMTIAPSVFHPGLFYSTKFLLTHVRSLNLSDKKVLELGAGSGLISLACSKEGAHVAASDINKEALGWLEKNAASNNCRMATVYSDLFDKINPSDYDLIVINPPYYPKDPESEGEHAWYCGSDFQYFQKLFQQLSAGMSTTTQVIMVLSEDCELDRIQGLARKYGLKMSEELSKRIGGELNLIYAIQKN